MASYARVVRHTISAVALVMSLYHLWVAFVGPPNALVLRSVHVGFALTLAFLATPWRKRTEASLPSVWEWALIAFAIAATAYPVVWIEYFLTGVARQAEDAVNRASRINGLLDRWRSSFAGLPSAMELVNLLGENPYWTVSGVARRLGIMKEMPTVIQGGLH